MTKLSLIKYFFVLLWAIGFNITLLAGSNINYPLTFEEKQNEAIKVLETAGILDPSDSWPNINSSLFILNIRRNIEHPENLYQGIHTNFCGYAALTYLIIKEDPLTYVNSLLGLYHHGYIKYGTKFLNPGEDVRFYAGTMHNKGLLDSLHADQMWFLTLADQFKGYVNFFDHHFDKGDENKLWAGVNYEKFNRMSKKLLGHNVEALGNDFGKPNIDDIPAYLQERLQKGKVVLMTNSRIKDHPTSAWIKLRLPVHYIVLQKIDVVKGNVVIEFWDYGGFKARTFSKQRFNKAVCGISTLIAEDDIAALR